VRRLRRRRARGEGGHGQELLRRRRGVRESSLRLMRCASGVARRALRSAHARVRASRAHTLTSRKPAPPSVSFSPHLAASLHRRAPPPTLRRPRRSRRRRTARPAGPAASAAAEAAEAAERLRRARRLRRRRLRLRPLRRRPSRAMASWARTTCPRPTLFSRRAAGNGGGDEEVFARSGCAMRRAAPSNVNARIAL